MNRMIRGYSFCTLFTAALFESKRGGPVRSQSDLG